APAPGSAPGRRRGAQDTEARAGPGATRRACGWVARGTRGRPEQSLAPDAGEWGWGAGDHLGGPGAGEAQRSGWRRSGLGLPHLGGEGETPQAGGPEADDGGEVQTSPDGSQRARGTASAPAPGRAPGRRRGVQDAAARAGPGATRRAGGWVARVTPCRPEQPLAPDAGERGSWWSGGARYRSPVPVTPSVRLPEADIFWSPVRSGYVADRG